MRIRFGSLIFGCVLCATLGFASTAAHAQVGDRLPGAVLGGDALTPAGQETIDQWADRLVKQLLEGSDTQVTDARDKLIDPLRSPLTKAPAAGAIAAAVTSRLAVAKDSKRLIVRLNALIVASSMPHATAGDLAIPLLDSKETAARYWAAKAVHDVMESSPLGRPVLDAAAQQRVLDVLMKIAPGEPVDAVAHQQFKALARLTIEGGRKALKEILLKRLAGHAASVNDGLRADVEALRSMHDAVVRDIANQQNNAQVEQELRDLCALAAKYLDVCTDAYQKKRLDGALKPLFVRLLETIEKVFNMSLNQIDAGWTDRPLLTGTVVDQPDLLRLNALGWVGTAEAPGVLTKSGLKIPIADLKPPAAAPATDVPPPAPAPPPTDAAAPEATEPDAAAPAP